MQTTRRVFAYFQAIFPIKQYRNCTAHVRIVNETCMFTLGRKPHTLPHMQRVCITIVVCFYICRNAVFFFFDDE